MNPAAEHGRKDVEGESGKHGEKGTNRFIRTQHWTKHGINIFLETSLISFHKLLQTRDIRLGEARNEVLGNIFEINKDAVPHICIL